MIVRSLVAICFQVLFLEDKNRTLKATDMLSGILLIALSRWRSKAGWRYGAAQGSFITVTSPAR